MDLGTGTGVIPLLLSYREKNARIQGLELQPEVLSMAQRSIALNHKMCIRDSPYTPQAEAVDLDAFGAGVKKEYERILVPAGLAPVKICLESGRMMTGPYGFLAVSYTHLDVYKRQVYNKTMVEEPITSWNALWDEKYKKQIFMLDSPRDSIGVALKLMGYGFNAENTEQLEIAKEKLIAQRPLVLSYVVDEVRDAMLAGEAAMALVWSGDCLLYTSRCV